MTLPHLGSLVPLAVADHPDLLAPSVVDALAAWPHADQLAVVESTRRWRIPRR